MLLSDSTSKIATSLKKPGALSGLQRNVLALYRSLLRKAYEKDGFALTGTGNESLTFLSCLQPEMNSSTTTHFTQQEFRRLAASVKKSDFKTIEHMIRKGGKYIKLLQMPGVKVVGGSASSPR